MQTLTYSNRSRYTLTPTRDVGAFRSKLDKCNGKHKRSPIRVDSRAYPKFEPGDSTADYVRAYESLNGCRNLRAIEWQTLNDAPCTLYSGEDAHETLPYGFDTWAEFDAAQESAIVAPESAQCAANDPGAPLDPGPAAPAGQAPTEIVPTEEDKREARAIVESFYDFHLRGAPGETIAADVMLERARHLRGSAAGFLTSRDPSRAAPYAEAARMLESDAAAKRAPVCAPDAPIQPAESAPPGYAFPDPLATHSLPRPVADMVAECRAKVAGDPRPQFGLRLQAAKRRAIAQGMRDGIAARAADPGTLAAWAINAPTNDAAADALDTLADAMPAPPAPTRAHVEHSFDAWRAEPDGYRGHVIECYGAARAQIEAAGGYPYNADAWPLAAAMMADRYGYPDARESGASDGVARAFGSHCYSAGCVLDARRKRERERTAAARFIPGQIIGRATWNDGKLCTGIVLQSVSADGAECRLTGKRAGRGFEWTCDAYSLQCAIERAAKRAGLLAERRKRSKAAPVTPPATHTAPVAEHDPVPTHSDAAEHYSAGAARADAIGNHRRADILRELAAEVAQPAPLPTDTGAGLAERPPATHSDPAAVVLLTEVQAAQATVTTRRAAWYAGTGETAPEEAELAAQAQTRALMNEFAATVGGAPLPGGSDAPAASGLAAMTDIERLTAEALRLAEVSASASPRSPEADHAAARAEVARRRAVEALRKDTGAAIIAQDLTLDQAAALCAHVDGGGSVDAWVKPGSPIDEDTAPAPLDGLDVAELGADGLAEFERAGGALPEPNAPAYSDTKRAAGPSLRIPATDPRARIPARFAPVYCLRA